MMTEKVTRFGKEFLKVELMSQSQKGKRFYVGKIPTKHFLELFTVEPAEYDIEEQTALAREFPDDKGYYEYLIRSLKKKIETRAFERKEEKSRISQISNFLNTEEYALFPNTIIVSCDLINDVLNIPEGTRFEDLEEFKDVLDENPLFSFLDSSGENSHLYIPYLRNSILIIDGQHRVKGLQEAKKEITDNYDLLVSFIIGYDRAVIAKLFYTINYTQKSVSKSLLYHLSGEFSSELDEMTFLHETVKIINELDYSPFYRRIKMLGSIPGNIPKEEKRIMTISQAFLIDYLKMTISKSAVRSIYQPIFLHYYENKNLQIEIIRFLLKYFSAVRNVKKQDWNDPEGSVICKTIGVGALIRVLHFLFVKMFVDEFQKDPLRIKKVTTRDLISKLYGIQQIDFSKEGEFGGVGSAGSLNRLKEKIIEGMAYFETDSYGDFLVKYKDKYLPLFKGRPRP